MRVSKAGVVLASAYAALSLVSIAVGYSFDDPDAGLIFLQLPLLPLLPPVLLWSAVAEPRLPDLPWPWALALGLPVAAAVLYGIGALVGRLGARTGLVLGSAVLAVVLVGLFWPR